MPKKAANLFIDKLAAQQALQDHERSVCFLIL